MTDHPHLGGSPTPDPRTPAVRSTQELFADPTTPDADLLGCPIPDAGALAAVLARPNKSPALIADLVGGVIYNRYPTHPIDNDVTACVLAETALSTEDLDALARTVQIRPRFDTSLIAALIVHPRLDPHAAIKVLWEPPALARRTWPGPPAACCPPRSGGCAARTPTSSAPVTTQRTHVNAPASRTSPPGGRRAARRTPPWRSSWRPARSTSPTKTRCSPPGTPCARRPSVPERGPLPPTPVSPAVTHGGADLAVPAHELILCGSRRLRRIHRPGRERRGKPCQVARPLHPTSATT